MNRTILRALNERAQADCLLLHDGLNHYSMRVENTEGRGVCAAADWLRNATTGRCVTDCRLGALNQYSMARQGGLFRVSGRD